MGLDFGMPSEAPNVQRFFNVNTIVDMREISAILMNSWSMENSGVKNCLIFSSRRNELCK